MKRHKIGNFYPLYLSLQDFHSLKPLLNQMNAAAATQQMLDLFDILGIANFGIAGNANNSLSIGDVTFPQQFSHTGIWDWLTSLSNGFPVIVIRGLSDLAGGQSGHKSIDTFGSLAAINACKVVKFIKQLHLDTREPGFPRSIHP
ncbi:Hypothetical predicted protein [Prunus dulcis]|uniref:Uncharacterized protein n=1 Tax=Prunus dulcis TaxID=3755 RepID=A0A5E4EEE9_PRUDU|nr:Hypothetical predicted protein [Prunus dulcis]